MARQAAPEEPEDDVPAWVMTFSDVITLLMTFFILLLTFATNTPETFDRLQVTLFGGGGAIGIAGTADGMDRDEILTRMRSRSGRNKDIGSSMPPTYSDPEFESITKSVAGLEKDEPVHTISQEYRITLLLESLVGLDQKPTSLGVRKLNMIASQMKRLPLDICLVVMDKSDIEPLFAVEKFLLQAGGIDKSRISFAISKDHAVSDSVLILLKNNQGLQSG